MKRFFAELVTILVLAAGCAAHPSAQPLVSRPQLAGIIDVTKTSSLPSATVVTAAVWDAQEFWAQEWPRIVGRGSHAKAVFEPFRAPEFVRTGQVFRCGTVTVAASELAANAFYCPVSDSVVSGASGWFDHLLNTAGPLSVAVIVGHELGHAIQHRMGITGESLGVELQADCFSGAWISSIVAGRSKLFRAHTEDLAAPIGVLLSLHDQLGTPASDPSAHGTGFDRAVAFMDGVEHGSVQCANYPAAYAGTTSQGFNSPADEARGGNQPIAEIAGPAFGDLQEYFTGWLANRGKGLPILRASWANNPVDCANRPEPANAAAATLCADNRVLLSGDKVADLDREGSVVVDAAIAHVFAAYALAAISVPDRDGVRADCLVGEWLGTLHPAARARARTRRLLLSPGDLDRVTQAILAGAFGSRPVLRFEAFAAGVYHGTPACLAKGNP